MVEHSVSRWLTALLTLYLCLNSASGVIDERRIFVGGITADMTYADLLEYFSQFGAVSTVDVIPKASQPIAFVSFEDVESATEAISTSPHSLKGICLKVHTAYTREEVNSRAAEGSSSTTTCASFPLTDPYTPSRACTPVLYRFRRSRFRDSHYY